MCELLALGCGLLVSHNIVEAAYDSSSIYFKSVCHIRKFTKKVSGIYVATISNYFIDYQWSHIDGGNH